MSDQAGIVTAIHGKAYAQSNEGMRELAEGSAIYCDEILKTGMESSLEIRFEDDAVLTQGENTVVRLDEYLYDPDAGSGRFAVDLMEGSLRSVTGRIVDMNPEGFSLDTNLTTIGIRGTTTAHVVLPDGSETHVVLDFVDKPVVIASKVTGDIRVVTHDGVKVSSGLMGLSPATRATPDEVRDLERFTHESTPTEGMPSQENVPDNHGWNHDGHPLGPEGDMLPPEFIDLAEAEGIFPGGEMGGVPLLVELQDGTFPVPFPFWMLQPLSEGELFGDSGQYETVTLQEGGDIQTETLDLGDEPTAVVAKLVGAGVAYYEVAGDPSSGVETSGGYEHIDGTDYDDVLLGNSEANNLNGNAGDDFIFGEAGADTLAGGEGSDTFSYAAVGEGADLIIDFNGGDDVLAFSLANFDGGGDLVAGVITSCFQETDNAAYMEDGSSGIDEDDHFIYYNDGESFSLYYDTNGSNAGGQVLIASFATDAELDASNVEVI